MNTLKEFIGNFKIHAQYVCFETMNETIYKRSHSTLAKRCHSSCKVSRTEPLLSKRLDLFFHESNGDPLLLRTRWLKGSPDMSTWESHHPGHWKPKITNRIIIYLRVIFSTPSVGKKEKESKICGQRKNRR